MKVKMPKIDGLTSLESPTKKSAVVQGSLTAYFTYCLYKSAVRLRLKLDEALAPHGLIAPQLGLLRLLKFGGSMSQIEIGRELDIDRATIVKLIDSLEKMKLVERRASVEDRRINKISLTNAGSKMFDKSTTLRESVEDDFLSHLTADERSFLRKVIPKLLR